MSRKRVAERWSALEAVWAGLGAAKRQHNGNLIPRGRNRKKGGEEKMRGCFSIHSTLNQLFYKDIRGHNNGILDSTTEYVLNDMLCLFSYIR
jgi:hypothetical protein